MVLGKERTDDCCFKPDMPTDTVCYRFDLHSDLFVAAAGCCYGMYAYGEEMGLGHRAHRHIILGV